MQKGHSLKHCQNSLAANLKFERVAPDDARSSQHGPNSKVVRESEIKSKSSRNAILLMLCLILYLPTVAGMSNGYYKIGDTGLCDTFGTSIDHAD